MEPLRDRESRNALAGVSKFLDTPVPRRDSRPAEVPSRDSEEARDFLTVNSQRFSGMVGPIGGVVASEMSWHTDGGTRRRGFKIW